MTPEPRGALDVAALRAETPGCQRRTHLNAAGAALMPTPVLDAMRDHLELEAALGGYEAADAAAPRVEAAYAAVGRLIGAAPGEIAFCDSGTRAWSMVVQAMELRPGDRIVVTETEYASNVVALQRLAARVAVEVDVVPHREDGALDVDAVVRRLDARVRLVAAVHVPTNNGVVNAVAELGRRLAGHGALYLVDACQSFGQLPLDVREIGCGALVASGRKYLRGPRGTAVIYAADAVVDRLRPAFADTYSATTTAGGRVSPVPGARRFETWEANHAARLGVGAAADYLLALGAARTWARLAALAAELRAALDEVPGVRVLDRGDLRSGLVTFALDGHDTDDVWQKLTRQGFALDVSRIQGSLYARWVPGLDAALRASVHYYNTPEEIHGFVRAVAGLATH